jgi:antitoxin HicB
MTDKQFYPIAVVELSADDGGGYLAYAPDLKGCMSDGETPEQAFKNGQQAVKEWIEHALAQKQEIPKPGSASANAIHARESLVVRIREQSATIESFDRELRELRLSLEAMTERLEKVSSEPAMWAAPVAYLMARRGTLPEDSFH